MTASITGDLPFQIQVKAWFLRVNKKCFFLYLCSFREQLMENGPRAFFLHEVHVQKQKKKHCIKFLCTSLMANDGWHECE